MGVPSIPSTSYGSIERIKCLATGTQPKAATPRPAHTPQTGPNVQALLQNRGNGSNQNDGASNIGD